MANSFDVWEATAFFRNKIEEFYTQSKGFEDFVNGGLCGWGYGLQFPITIGDYTCRISGGSERTCVIFDKYGESDGFSDRYVLKCSTIDTQFEYEMRNYQSFECLGYASLCTQQVEVDPDDILPACAKNHQSMENVFYIVERADVDEEYNNQCLREYIFDNIECFKCDFDMYSYEWYGKDYDELDPEQKTDMVWEFVYNEDIFSNTEKLSWLLSEYNDIDLNCNYFLYNLIADIGDFHVGNISLASGHVKLVDYGWGKSGEES